MSSSMWAAASFSEANTNRFQTIKWEMWLFLWLGVLTRPACWKRYNWYYCYQMALYWWFHWIFIFAQFSSNLSSHSSPALSWIALLANSDNMIPNGKDKDEQPINIIPVQWRGAEWALYRSIYIFHSLWFCSSCLIMGKDSDLTVNFPF